MRIWAIADLHLPFGDPSKDMSIYGPDWENYTQRIEANWRERVSQNDLVLIPGDLSWAMRPEQALADLEWVDALPGKKVISRGNHDLWWSSASKVRKILPPSIQALHHSALVWEGVAICGTRLWDSDEYNFADSIIVRPNPKATVKEETVDDAAIFNRELGRLEMALKALDSKAHTKIAMVHYPPIGADLQPSKVSSLLEKYGVDICVFGHLHSLDKTRKMFGEARGVRYVLTSCDYVNCTPVELLDLGQ